MAWNLNNPWDIYLRKDIACVNITQGENKGKFVPVHTVKA
jgi:hypothetical protein